MPVPRTLDGRYIIVRGRLWRATNPTLPEETRAAHVSALMTARRQVKAALASGSKTALSAARSNVNAAKIALGERGPVWWTDGAPDLNRRMARSTPYAAWWAREERKAARVGAADEGEAKEKNEE